MRKRTKIAVTLCFATTTVLTGCGVGNVLFPRANVDVVDVDDPSLSNKYLSRPNEGKPGDISDIKDNLYIAAGVLKETEHWSSQMVGKVQAKVGFIPYDQSVADRRTVNDDEFFFETLTISSFVKKAEQRFVNENSWLVRNGDSPSMEGAVYSSDNIKAYSKKGYLERYGNYSNGISNYVLNDETIESGTFDGYADGLYTYTYTLDEEKATAKYIREVKVMAGASDYPIFSKAKLTISIDENWVVHKVSSIDTYSISLMGGLTCNSRLDDVFTYSDNYIDIPEKADFSTKFGTVDSEDGEEAEKTAIDYLTEAAAPLMTGTKPVDVEAEVLINGQKLPIYASLDLNQMKVKVSLADQAYLVYQEDKVYLWLGPNLKFFVQKDELLTLVQHYAPNFDINGISLDALLSSDLMSSMMEDMTMEKTESAVKIGMSLDGGNVALNLKLDAKGAASFDNIILDYKKDSLDISAQAKLFTAPHSYQDIPSDIAEITNLSGLAASLDRFIEGRKVAGHFDFRMGPGARLSGDFNVDFSAALRALIDFDLIVGNQTLSFRVTVIGEQIYLYLNDQTVVNVSFEELLGLVGDALLKFGLVDLQGLNGLGNLIAPEVDILTAIGQLFTNFDPTANSISVGLDFASLGLNQSVSLEYAYDSSELTLLVDSLGSVELKPGPALELATPAAAFKGQKALTALLDYAARVYANPRFKLNLEYRQESIVLEIKAQLDLQKMSAEADVTFDVAGIRGTARFVLEQNRLYFTLADRIKAMLTPEELSQLVEKLQRLLEIKLDQSSLDLERLLGNFDLDSLPIGAVIDSLRLAENGDIFLSLPTDWLGASSLPASIDFVFSPENNSLNAASGPLSLELIASPNVLITAPDTRGFVTFADLDRLIDACASIAARDSFDLSLSLEAVIGGRKVVVPARIQVLKQTNNIIKAHMSLTLEGQELILDIDSGSCYLTWGSLKLSSSVAAMSLLARNALAAAEAEIAELNYLLDVIAAQQTFDLSYLLELLSPRLEGAETIDLNQLIGSFSFVDGRLDMSLVQGAKTIALALDLKDSAAYKLQLSSADFSADLLLASDPVELPIVDTSAYLSLDPLANLSAETLLDLFKFVRSGRYQIDLAALSFEAGSESFVFDGRLAVDIENLRLSGQLQLTWRGETYSLNLGYADGVVIFDLESKIYFRDSLANISQLVEEIEAQFGLDFSSALPTDNFDLGKIFDLLSQTLVSVNADADRLDLGLDLRALGLGDTARLSYVKNLGLDLVTANHGEILIAPCDQVAALQPEPGRYYLNAAEASSYLHSVSDLLAAGVYDSSVSLGLSTGLGRLDVVGALRLDLAGKLDFSLDAFVSNPDFHVDLKVTKRGDLFYVDFGTVHFVLSTDELCELLLRIDSDYQLGLPINDYSTLSAGIKALSTGDFKNGAALISQSLALGGNSAGSLPLDKLSLKTLIGGLSIEENTIALNADLSSLSPWLGQTFVRLDKTSGLSLDLETSGPVSQLTLQKATAPIRGVTVDDTWLTAADLNDILTKVGDILGFARQKKFHGRVSGTVVTAGALNYEYSADANIDLSDSLDPKFHIVADVKGPLTGKTASYHVEATFAGKRLYGIYNYNLKFSISWSETLQLVRYVTDLMGIKSPILASILDGVTEGMDTGVFDPVVPDFAPLDIDINSFLHSVAVDKTTGKLQLGLDCSKLYGFETADPVLRASINTAPDLISSISVNNIYSKADEQFNIELNFDDLYETITAPDASGWFDFDSLTDLLKQFFVTADIGSYSLQGTANLKIKIMIGSLNLAGLMSDYDIPVKVDIELDERSVPTVHAVLNIPKINPMWITVAEKGDVDIYFYQNTLYFRRGSEYRTYTVAELGNNDKIYDLVCFILKPSNTIKNTIKSSMDGGMSLKDPLLIENILSSYNSTNTDGTYTYNLKLSGSDVMVKNLDDVNLSISTLSYLEKVYLRHLYVETTLMNLLAIKLNGDLVNISDQAAPQKVSVPIPSNLTEPGAAW